MDRNGEVKGQKDVDLMEFRETFSLLENQFRRKTVRTFTPVGQKSDPVVIKFTTVSHTPPVRNPSGLSRRERILALYRQQGRPQAHLDRVVRLGMESPEEVRKKWEARMRKGVRQDWSSYV